MKTVGKITLAILIGIHAMGGSAYSDDKLQKRSAAKEGDGHISWSEFRRELGNFPQVTATIKSNGVVTLAGHTDDGPDKNAVELIATKIRGATRIVNLIVTD